jgi:hypothetical protein
MERSAADEEMKEKPKTHCGDLANLPAALAPRAGVPCPIFSNRRSTATTATAQPGSSKTRSGIESDDVANCYFPKTWPSGREQRARIIGTVDDGSAVSGLVTESRRFPPLWSRWTPFVQR